jgi:hypothetical protein
LRESRRQKVFSARVTAGGGAACASALLGALADRLLKAAGADGGVDGGGADVGVTSELADPCGVGSGVGEVGAEGVAQHVG